jgi:hypothetical protein
MPRPFGSNSGWLQPVTSRLLALTSTATTRKCLPSSRTIASSVRRQPGSAASGTRSALNSSRARCSVNQLSSSTVATAAPARGSREAASASWKPPGASGRQAAGGRQESTVRASMFTAFFSFISSLI